MPIKCLFFGCEDSAEFPFVCCNIEHGWLHKGMVSQLKKYQRREINWRYLWASTQRQCPTIEEMIYYNQLINNTI